MDNYNKNKSLDANNLASDLSTLNGLWSGITNIFSPAAQNQKQIDTDKQKAKDKRNMFIFLAAAVILAIVLTGFIFIPKSK